MKISGIRALVVDDNQVNLKVAKNNLNHYGLDVDTALDGFTAIHLCSKNHYPLIFLDHMMPDMDGVETMKQIRLSNSYYNHNVESKFIALTANTDSSIREQLLEEGFDEYLEKPMDSRHLEQLLDRFLPTESITTPNCSLPLKDFTYLKEILPEVNISLGIENCGGQLEDYLKVLEIAWHYGEQKLDELSTLHKQHDYVTYTIKVHSLKSTTRNIGAVEISDMAKAQEAAGNKQEYSYIDEHKDELQAAYRSLLSKIHTVLLHYNCQSDDSAVNSQDLLSEEAIPFILMNIRQCIDDFDFTKAFDLLDKVQTSRLPTQYQDTFSKLSLLLDDLALDEIQLLLDESLQ